MSHKRRSHPTQNQLKELFDYDSVTGNLLRKSSISKKFYVAGWDHISGARYLSIDSITYLQHRLVYIWHNGDIPDNMEVDHIYNDRTDQRIENLQLLSSKDNTKKKIMYKANKSGMNGVSFHKRDQIWAANIRVDTKLIHLGYFKNIDDAISARKAANKLYGFAETHGTQKTA